MTSNPQRVHIVAEYRDRPTEGMQVISKTLTDDLRRSEFEVTVVEPRRIWRWLPRLIATRPRCVVFTHGPGRGVVLASAILRRTTRAQIIWVATRPDLKLAFSLPRAIQTAHSVIANGAREDLARAAPGTRFHQHFIGIDCSRMGQPTGNSPWPELGSDRPIALHVGHLKRNRNLEALADAKRVLGDTLEVVVQGSPTFETESLLIDELESAGVLVRQGFVENLADLYQAADIYLFPLTSDQAGAIDLPLSVLEAVSSGLPVLTNDFGALRAALSETPGVHFTTPGQFTDDLASLVTHSEELACRPDGLPSHLDASQLTAAIIDLAKEHQ